MTPYPIVFFISAFFLLNVFLLFFSRHVDDN